MIIWSLHLLLFIIFNCNRLFQNVTRLFGINVLYLFLYTQIFSKMLQNYWEINVPFLSTVFINSICKKFRNTQITVQYSILYLWMYIKLNFQCIMSEYHECNINLYNSLILVIRTMCLIIHVKHQMLISINPVRFR